MLLENLRQTNESPQRFWDSANFQEIQVEPRQARPAGQASPARAASPAGPSLVQGKAVPAGPGQAGPAEPGQTIINGTIIDYKGGRQPERQINISAILLTGWKIESQ